MIARGPGPGPTRMPSSATTSTAAIAVRVADCVPVLLAEEDRPGGCGHPRGVARCRQPGDNRRRDRAADLLWSPAGAHHCRRRSVHRSVLLRSVGEHGIRRSARPVTTPRCSNAGSDPSPSGKFHLDLWRATRDQLEGAGVMPDNIHIAELCTKTHADRFHSYRVEGNGGGEDGRDHWGGRGVGEDGGSEG